MEGQNLLTTFNALCFSTRCKHHFPVSTIFCPLCRTLKCQSTSVPFRFRRVANRDASSWPNRLEKLLANDKPWHEFPTPQDYRVARRDGTHGLKKPLCNDKARLINFTGREGNSIELRVIEPTTGPSKGVWLHFHAGTSHSVLIHKREAHQVIQLNRGLCHWQQCLVRPISHPTF